MLRNFPQGNSSADPLQEKLQVFYIDRKATESDEAVEFEPPARRTCGIAHSDPANPQPVHLAVRGGYRTGKGCDYAGSRYFDDKGNPVDDPSQDRCGGLLSDCQNALASTSRCRSAASPARR